MWEVVVPLGIATTRIAWVHFEAKAKYSYGSVWTSLMLVRDCLPNLHNV